MTQNVLADTSGTEIAQSAIRTTTVKENLLGIRIRGIPESKNDGRCRQGHDFNAAQKVLEHINIEAAL